jgi:hypothetical protein
LNAHRSSGCRRRADDQHVASARALATDRARDLRSRAFTLHRRRMGRPAPWAHGAQASRRVAQRAAADG